MRAIRPIVQTTLLLAMLFVAAAPLVGAVSQDSLRFVPPPRSPHFAPPAHGVLFADDFSAGIGRWTADRDSVWSAWGGMLRADLPDERQVRSLIYAGDEKWTDYAVDLDVCAMRGVDKGVVVRADGDVGIGVDLRGPGYEDVVMYRREWPFGRERAVNGNTVWHHLRVEVRGQRYRVFVDGDLKLDRTDSRKLRTSGRIGLPAYTGGVAECTVYYDNVIVTELK